MHLSQHYNPEQPQTPIDDLPDDVLQAVVGILRHTDRRRYPLGGMFRTIGARIPAMATLHDRGLVDLVPTVHGMIVTRRDHR